MKEQGTLIPDWSCVVIIFCVRRVLDKSREKDMSLVFIDLVILFCPPPPKKKLSEHSCMVNTYLLDYSSTGNMCYSISQYVFLQHCCDYLGPIKTYCKETRVADIFQDQHWSLSEKSVIEIWEDGHKDNWGEIPILFPVCKWPGYYNIEWRGCKLVCIQQEAEYRNWGLKWTSWNRISYRWSWLSIHR